MIISKEVPKKGFDKMGMTDTQFKSLRREHLEGYEEMLEIAKQECSPDSKLIVKLEKEILKAKADIES